MCVVCHIWIDKFRRTKEIKASSGKDEWKPRDYKFGSSGCFWLTVWFSLYSQKFIKLSHPIFFLISHKMCKQMSIKGKKKCWYILLTRYCNLHVSDLAFVSCLVCTNGRALELPVFQARSQVGDSHWQGLLVTEEKLWYILLFSHNQAEGIH